MNGVIRRNKIANTKLTKKKNTKHARLTSCLFKTYSQNHFECFLILIYAFVYNLSLTRVPYYVDGVPMLKSYRVTFNGSGNSPLISLFSTTSYGRGSFSQIIIPSTLLPRNVLRSNQPPDRRTNLNEINEKSILQRIHGNQHKGVDSHIDAHSKLDHVNGGEGFGNTR